MVKLFSVVQTVFLHPAGQHPVLGCNTLAGTCRIRPQDTKRHARLACALEGQLRWVLGPGSSPPQGSALSRPSVFGIGLPAHGHGPSQTFRAVETVGEGLYGCRRPTVGHLGACPAQQTFQDSSPSKTGPRTGSSRQRSASTRGCLSYICLAPS